MKLVIVLCALIAVAYSCTLSSECTCDHHGNNWTPVCINGVCKCEDADGNHHHGNNHNNGGHHGGNNHHAKRADQCSLDDPNSCADHTCHVGTANCQHHGSDTHGHNTCVCPH